MNYEHIVDKECDLDIYQCNNCGAYAKEIKLIKHHTTCKQGESKYWEEYYSNVDEESEIKDEEEK